LLLLQVLEQVFEPIFGALGIPEYVEEEQLHAEEMLRFSTQHQQTLLVMTTHGRIGLRRILLGSVAIKVVQEAHVPVLLVRGRQS
jgi:nucleotide-binding universal stress UspA family protein